MKRRTFLETWAALLAVAGLGSTVDEDVRSAPTISYDVPDSAGRVLGDEFSVNGVVLSARDIKTHAVQRHIYSGGPYYEVEISAYLIDRRGIVQAAFNNQEECNIRYREQGRLVEGQAFATTCGQELNVDAPEFLYRAVFTFTGPVTGLT